jgi:hypothetical protein
MEDLVLGSAPAVQLLGAALARAPATGIEKQQALLTSQIGKHPPVVVLQSLSWLTRGATKDQSIGLTAQLHNLSPIIYFRIAEVYTERLIHSYPVLHNMFGISTPVNPSAKGRYSLGKIRQGEFGEEWWREKQAGIFAGARAAYGGIQGIAMMMRSSLLTCRLFH